MNATSRTVKVSGILLALLFAVLTIQATEAAPNDGRRPPSIKSRVQSQRDLCETVGGGKLSVNETYKTNGPFKTLVSATTTCAGGTGDGYTCTNTQKETKCTQTMTSPDETPRDTVRPEEGAVGGLEQPSEPGRITLVQSVIPDDGQVAVLDETADDGAGVGSPPIQRIEADPAVTGQEQPDDEKP